MGAWVSTKFASHAHAYACTAVLRTVFINAWRACARVTVLGLSVFVSACRLYSGTSRNQVYKQQYQRLQHDTGMEYKMGFLLKVVTCTSL